MNKQSLHILLVEDNEPDQFFFRTLIEGAQGPSYSLATACNLSEANSLLEKELFDICFTDLGLPDSHGIETLQSLLKVSPALPFIVLTGGDESLSTELLQIGAQDFLEKDNLALPLLQRTIRYAIERQHLRQELQSRMRTKVNQRSEEMLERISDYTGNLSVTSLAFGIRSLSEAFPDLYNEFEEIYINLLEQAVEKQIFKLENNISGELRDLADRLGFLKANPKDIIHLHRKSLEKKCLNIPHQKATLFIDEGRLLVVELMGYLVLYYRKFAFGM